MLLNLNKMLFFLMLIVLMNFRQLIADEFSAEIYNKDYPLADTIHLGVTKPGKFLETGFVVKNTGEKRIRTSELNPSFYFGQSSVFYPNWVEFEKYYKLGEIFNPPIVLKSDSTLTFTVRFLSQDIGTIPVGRNEVLIRIGLFDADKLEAPPSEYIASDTFLVVAKKTLHNFDSYENIIRFDSVYVNPDPTPKVIWKLKNVHDLTVKVDSSEYQTIKGIPGKKAFCIDQPQLPNDILAGNITDDWKISYCPTETNPNGDSAVFRINYSPFPAELPKNDLPYVGLSGTAVKQELDVIPLNAEWGEWKFPDTTRLAVNLGNIRVGESKNFNILVKNIGNIPFGTTAQNIYDYYSDQKPGEFNITRKILKKGNHLYPDFTDTLSVSFSPDEAGYYYSKIVLKSDIVNRKIFGVPNAEKDVIIYLIARGTAPVLSYPLDTIDLGTIVNGCPARRVDSIPLINLGNEDLHIDLYTNPSSRFEFYPVSFVIPPYQGKPFYLRYEFAPNNLFGEIRDSILLVSNQIDPMDSIRIFFKGFGVPLSKADISLPDIRSKSGRLIKIPIIVSDGKASLASRFEDKLRYNHTLMKFLSYSTPGTASEYSENSSDTDVREEREGGVLNIVLQMPLEDEYFKDRDTLVNLFFTTYLGTSISTPITFDNPRFSDKICDEVLSFNPAENIFNGSFTLDSICGLEYKVNAPRNGVFELSEVIPNPVVDRLKFEFVLAYSSSIEFTIFNNYGEPVKSILYNELKEGTYEQDIDISEFSTGLYYLHLNAGFVNRTKKFIIAK